MTTKLQRQGDCRLNTLSSDNHDWVSSELEPEFLLINVFALGITSLLHTFHKLRLQALENLKKIKLQVRHPTNLSFDANATILDFFWGVRSKPGFENLSKLG